MRILLVLPSQSERSGERWVVMIVGRLVMLSLVAAMVTPKLWAQALIPMNVPPQPEMLPESIRTGKVEVTPNSGVAGEYGTWTVTYQPGGTIKLGGGIRVQLPEAWHAGRRNSANRLQATAPGEPNYVTARCSDPNVALQTTVEFESPDVLVKSVKPSNMTLRMGTLSATGPVSIRLRALGTDVIDSVQVLRHRKGHPGFQIIRDESPAQEQVVLSFTDGGFTGDAVYYARVRQRHRVRESIAMAWSSPIRVRFP